MKIPENQEVVSGAVFKALGFGAYRASQTLTVHPIVALVRQWIQGRLNEALKAFKMNKPRLL
jgi:hypothetical protein